MTGRVVSEWIGAHPDQRAPARVRLRIFEAHEGRCHISGRKIGPGEPWELEHIRPLCLGGENRETNLAPALATVHREKTREDVAAKAKAQRLAKKHTGAADKPRAVIPGSKASGWKRRIDGTTVRRSDNGRSPRRDMV